MKRTIVRERHENKGDTLRRKGGYAASNVGVKLLAFKPRRAAYDARKDSVVL